MKRFKILIAVGVCFGVFCFLNSLISAKCLKIRHEYIKSSKLSKSIKLLHISDLHSNSPTKLNVNIWKKIKDKKIDFDAVVITGDIILNRAKQLTPHIPYIKEIAEDVPVFFVEGNHDTFDFQEIKQMLAEVGVRTLANESTTAKINGEEINIVGTRDYYYLRYNNFKDVDKAFKELDENKFTLVLTHQPQIFDRLLKYEPDLVLSGHTHGGQVRLPFFKTLYAPSQGIFPKYGDGLYESENSKLYVSRGVGTTVFPIRFFNLAEVTVLEIN